MAGSSSQSIDGEKIARDRYMGQVQAQRQRAVDWAQQQLGYIQVAGNAHGPTNPTAQWGEPKSVSSLGALLRQINPRLHLDPTPEKGFYSIALEQKDPTTKRLTKQHLFCCGAAAGGLLPEYSVMESMEIELPNMDNRMAKFDPATLRTKSLGAEKIRGWRTVMVRLVHDGFATPTQVERLVGPSPRLSWAAHLGKRDHRALQF
jgi:hypothetical protein